MSEQQLPGKLRLSLWIARGLSLHFSRPTLVPHSDRRRIEGLRRILRIPDLGPNERSLRNVSQRLQEDYGLIARWSGTWPWVVRSMARDPESDRLRQSELTTLSVAMARRQMLAGRLIRSKAMKRFTSTTNEEVSRLSVWEAYACSK